MNNSYRPRPAVEMKQRSSMGTAMYTDNDNDDNAI